MRYAYPCRIFPDEGGFLCAEFRDVPEAHTGWPTREQTLVEAEDALAAALAAYVYLHREIPTPSPALEGEDVISVPPIVAAKLALYTAMREQRITNVALGERLGLSESAVRKLVDPDHRSHISSVMKALRAVGRNLVVEDRAA